MPSITVVPVGEFVSTVWVSSALAGTGALTGLMTGLLGVGGGFVIVPMLLKLTNVSMHGIVATSLMVVALVGSGGVVSTIEAGVSPPLRLTLLFGLTTALGMIVGRGASPHLSARHVQVGFAAVLVCVSLGMMAKAVFDT